jgi:ribosome-associated toxin RatA of RatAB toxin-antitoxin module
MIARFAAGRAGAKERGAAHFSLAESGQRHYPVAVPRSPAVGAWVAPILGLCFSCFSGAEAEARTLASRKDAIKPEALTGLLARGELALIESEPDGSPRQVVVFAVIHVPPERVFDAIFDVENYPKFMKVVARQKITRRSASGSMIAYEWEDDLPIFNLKGERMMRGQRPAWIEVKGVAGNFKDSLDRWELYPLDGGKATLAALYRAVDVKTAGVLVKTMVAVEPSMEHGLILAAGFVHLHDLRAYLEGPATPPASASAPATAPAGPRPKLERLPLGAGGLDLVALRGLMDHGQVALIESERDGHLRQVVMLTVVHAPLERLAATVQAADKYPEFIPNIKSQTMTPLGPGRFKLEYALNVPLVSVSGISEMTVLPGGAVDVVATGGDVQSGRWRWEFQDLGAGDTVPIHYAYTSVAETSWLAKQLVEKQPLFEHGIVAAASTIAVRAMKARAEGTR